MVNCHQCRHRIKESEEAIYCTNCKNKYSVSCLKRNYEEIVPEMSKASWICPRCRGICNCDKCRPSREEGRSGGRNGSGRGRGRGRYGGRGRGPMVADVEVVSKRGGVNQKKKGLEDLAVEKGATKKKGLEDLAVEKGATKKKGLEDLAVEKGATKKKGLEDLAVEKGATKKKEQDLNATISSLQHDIIKLHAEFARFKEDVMGSTDKLSTLEVSCSSCSSQRDQISVLQHQKKLERKSKEDLAVEKEDTINDSCVEAEAAAMTKEHELNATICKLETSISSLKASLANEESQKLLLEKDRDSIREVFRRVLTSPKVKLTAEELRRMMVYKLRRIMDYKHNIRNISVIDHGKSTLTDSLVAAAAGIIAQEESAGDVRMTDTAGISLYYQMTDEDLKSFKGERNGNEYLINLVGHHDFSSSEVTAALRITDGALVVVDCIEGVCVQTTKTVVRQALGERIRPVLTINNLDRCFLDGEEAYQTFQTTIENFNSLMMATYEDSLLGDVMVYPEKGTVAFSAGSDGWGFSLTNFAKLYACHFGVDVSKMMELLWGDNFFDSETRKWTKQNTGAASCKRGFVNFCYEPIKQIIDFCMNDKKDVLWPVLAKLGVTMKIEEKELMGKPLMKHVMQNWLPAAKAVLEMMIFHLPSPHTAQRYRVENLYEGPLDDAYANAIRNCDPDGPLMLYVSKMVPASDKGRFFAFGRVFAGTLSTGMKVRIMGPNFVPGEKKHLYLYVKSVDSTVIWMGKKQETVEDVPCGNTVAMVVSTIEEESGENIIAGGLCLKDLEEAIVKSDDPLVSLRETVVEESLQDHSSRVEAEELKKTEEELKKKDEELKKTEEELKKKDEELKKTEEAVRDEQDRRVYDIQARLREAENQVEDIRNASLMELRQEVLKTQQIYSEEIIQLGVKIQGLVDAAQNYHTLLTENRKLYNQVQDLKGKIRVYCRIRPFSKGQDQKQTTIEYIGDDGELVVTNRSIVKERRQLFRFNKVFGPASTQEEVFVDTQPLIRSVLDGYNVCIFAYGQTGSGKTYTMTGPNVSSPEDWGVNYRALNDLFHLSQIRRSSFEYEIGVQMMEIHNEHVLDLLSSDTRNQNLVILNSAQPKGLAVPDASMHPVTSTADVLELMNHGSQNRSVGATALNESSSRSHSVLSVHVNGKDLKTKGVLRGNLHLVDLAGSVRVGRSKAAGDRLTEAQHINRSLSALGDVINALANKSQHVPYRNSKLTQVLQSSLGGQAKTLVFVQLNPELESFSKTLSTLKFAERLSAVELGLARSNRERTGV